MHLTASSRLSVSRYHLTLSPSLLPYPRHHGTNTDDNDHLVTREPQPPIPPSIPLELATPALQPRPEHENSNVPPEDDMPTAKKDSAGPPTVSDSHYQASGSTDTGSALPVSDQCGPRRSTRPRKPPSHLHDFVMDY